MNKLAFAAVASVAIALITTENRALLERLVTFKHGRGR